MYFCAHFYGLCYLRLFNRFLISFPITTTVGRYFPSRVLVRSAFSFSDTFDAPEFWPIVTNEFIVLFFSRLGGADLCCSLSRVGGKHIADVEARLGPKKGARKAGRPWRIKKMKIPVSYLIILLILHLYLHLHLRSLYFSCAFFYQSTPLHCCTRQWEWARYIIAKVVYLPSQISCLLLSALRL